GKLVQIPMLLKLSVYIGIVHLFIGYCCKFFNMFTAHGIKHAFLESGGWLFAFVGMVLLCYSMAYALLSDDMGAAIMGDFMIPLMAGAVILIIGLILNVKSEGVMSVMEMPGIVGNILSYTRLAAIGMSKAGMATAFNYIAFSMIFEGMGSGLLAVVVAFVVFLVFHLLIFFLAILSAGLHALRLQYVELMAKFFEGGGKEYSPLKITRKKTFFKNPINKKTKTEV
ncbi:MAG TPA: V-type ATPase 116kDa subunit family protein, partial [Candidatus Methanomethylophilaceae archaeon]|nr:V-type ATPase 116kDa subunit family protein [Candidatus Methanomethylophilaceae archaeon]